MPSACGGAARSAPALLAIIASASKNAPGEARSERADSKTNFADAGTRRAACGHSNNSQRGSHGQITQCKERAALELDGAARRPQRKRAIAIADFGLARQRIAGNGLASRELA